jgi:hypothetical protein
MRATRPVLGDGYLTAWRRFLRMPATGSLGRLTTEKALLEARILSWRGTGWARAACAMSGWLTAFCVAAGCRLWRAPSRPWLEGPVQAEYEMPAGS